MRARVSVVLCTCVFMPAFAAQGAQFQDLAELDARVATSLQGNGVATPIDRRIKLAQCSSPPAISPPINGSVAVRCPDKGWRLAVLISGAASQVQQPQDIAVRRGDTIEIVARGEGFTISSSGTALDEGAQGKSIRVKMPTASAPISATILRPGVVGISF